MFEEHVRISKDVLNLIISILRKYRFQAASTWITVLSTLLQTSQYLVATDQDEEGTTTNYGGVIAPYVVQVLLETFMRSQTRAVDACETLRRVLQKWRHRHLAVYQSCSILLAITASVISHLNGIGVPVPTLMHTEFALNRVGDIPPAVAKGSAVQIDPRAPESIVVMEPDQLFFMWRMMFGVAGDVLAVHNPKSFNVFAETAHHVCCCLLESRERGTTPDTNTVFSIVGPFLFRCTTSDVKRAQIAEGRAMAFTALTKIFCNRRRSSRPLPRESQLAFVMAVHTALSQPAMAHDMVPTIITLNGSALLSMEYSGSLLVAPLLLNHLITILGRMESPFKDLEFDWCIVRKMAVACIGSMLGMSSAVPQLALSFPDSETFASTQIVLIRIPPSGDADDVPGNVKSKKIRAPRFQKVRPETRTGARFMLDETLLHTPTHEGKFDQGTALSLRWFIFNTLTKAIFTEFDPANQKQIFWNLCVNCFEDSSNQGIVQSTIKVIERFVLRQEISMPLDSYRVACTALSLIIKRSTTTDPKVLASLLDNLVIFLNKHLTECTSSPPDDGYTPNVNNPDFSTLITTGFSSIVDLVNGCRVRITKEASDLLVTALNPLAVRSLNQLVADDVSLSARVCLMRLFYPFPTCAPKATTSSSSTVFVGCAATNAIIALTDIPSNEEETVRVVVRNIVGEFVLNVSPVWEDAKQASERASGTQLSLTHAEGVWPIAAPEDPSNDELTTLFNTNNHKLLNQLDDLKSQSRIETENLLKSTDVPVGSKAVLLPPPATDRIPPTRYTTGGRHNHVVRLVLGTMGAMSPAIGTTDVFLLRNDTELAAAIANLDNNSPYRAEFHIGVSGDRGNTQAFWKFFSQLGDPHGSNQMRWCDDRISLLFSNRNSSTKAVDDLMIRWSEQFITDDDVNSETKCIFVHPTGASMFVIRFSPDVAIHTLGPLLDDMVVSLASVVSCLRWTVIQVANHYREMTCFPDIAQRQRELMIKQILNHFKSDDPINNLLLDTKSKS
eukprot:c7885_g1_i2.p1 GENE.c7885_g1_i2~~c7885_g1_i2.p1  ORF type:complete len:1151 (+),score=329.08 c7885_g1_i2:417-3455(+)